MNMEYPSFKERCKKECTRDVIFLFQQKRINWHQVPEGWEYDDGVLTMEEDDAFLATKEEIEKFLSNKNDEKPYISLKEMYDRLNCYDTHEYYSEYWDTERVFLTREEGEHYGKCRSYNYPDGWRVYSVCAEGKLAELIKET